MKKTLFKISSVLALLLLFLINCGPDKGKNNLTSEKEIKEKTKQCLDEMQKLYSGKEERFTNKIRYELETCLLDYLETKKLSKKRSIFLDAKLEVKQIRRNLEHFKLTGNTQNIPYEEKQLQLYDTWIDYMGKDIDRLSA
jgi:hypothetical protein